MLGIDAADMIEVVGESVKDFKDGDEVFGLCGIENRTGAFHEIITISSYQAANKSAFLTFEEAAVFVRYPRVRRKWTFS